MTMALTMSQAFLGAITIGVGLSRGVEADLSVTMEDLHGEANYAASRVGAGHAKASNAIAENNTLAAAAMSPRLSVESDNITMDESAKIACPQKTNPIMVQACQQYTQNKPRAQEKLEWIRTQQSTLWGSLQKVSGSMQQIAGSHGLEDVKKGVASADPSSTVSMKDPTATKQTYGNQSAATACSLASQDAQKSQMVGHAFPLLMPNILPQMPKGLVNALPGAMCNVGGAAGGAGSSGSSALSSLQGLAPAATSIQNTTPGANGQPQEGQQIISCDDIQQNFDTQVEYAKENKIKPVFSSDVQPYAITLKSGRSLFDRKACDKAQEQNSPLANLGLTSMPNLGSGIGGSTLSPSASNPNTSDDFRACSSVSRSVDTGTKQISDAARTLMSFGDQPSQGALAQSASRSSCGKWYYPTGNGSKFASTPKDQQAFVPAWKHTLVAQRPGQ